MTSKTWNLILGAVAIVSLAAATRSGNWHDVFTRLPASSAPTKKVTLVGSQVSEPGHKLDPFRPFQVAILVVMPSCASCTTKPVDHLLPKGDLGVPVVFVYPDDLTLVPEEQLPAGCRSLALSAKEIRGLPMEVFYIAPVMVAVDERLVIVRQAADNVTIADFAKEITRK